LYNKELHNLYSSSDINRMITSMRMRWAGHVAHIGELRNACKLMFRKAEGNRPLGRPRHTWEDNIKMYHNAIG
jgi:hypothetical protein